MRILLISHGFPPVNLGGTEIYTRALGRILSAEFGDEVFVLTREADADRPEYEVRNDEVDGMQVHRVNNTFARCRSFAETYRNPKIREIGARLVDELRPDVCHLQHLTCLSTELISELRGRRVPIVFTLNDYWLICHRGQLLDAEMKQCAGPETGCGRCIAPHAGHGRGGFVAAAALRAAERGLPDIVSGPLRSLAVRAADRLLRSDLAEEEAGNRGRHMLDVANAVDRLLAPSKTLLERFLSFGVDPERISLVQQGIEHHLLDGVSPAGETPIRFGFLGSMMASKGAHVLLESFSGLPEGAATLSIFGGFSSYHGDDSYREQVAPLLEQPGVLVHGPLPHERVAEVFSAIDVLVIPSIWLENAPFVIREACVAGRPVVATGHGGMAEMVQHEVSGLLFTPGSVDSLREVLRRFVDEPGLVARLQTGIPRMMTIAEDAAQLREIYGELGAGR